MSQLHIVRISLFLMPEGEREGGGGETGDDCVRPGAIHHARLAGIFKDNKPSAAAIHQL